MLTCKLVHSSTNLIVYIFGGLLSQNKYEKTEKVFFKKSEVRI